MSSDATLVLPVIGSVPVGAASGPELASEISRRLQAKLGTVDTPNTTVEILEYPPVYVVGNVRLPGVYGFRTGLTALQALALGGGEVQSGADRSRDEIRLVGDLRSLEKEVLRGSARIARLRAEMAEAAAIVFRPRRRMRPARRSPPMSSPRSEPCFSPARTKSSARPSR